MCRLLLGLFVAVSVISSTLTVEWNCMLNEQRVVAHRKIANRIAKQIEQMIRKTTLSDSQNNLIWFAKQPYLICTQGKLFGGSDSHLDLNWFAFGNANLLISSSVYTHIHIYTHFCARNYNIYLSVHGCPA